MSKRKSQSDHSPPTRGIDSGTLWNWGRFRARYPEWCDRLDLAKSIYSLPEVVVDALAGIEICSEEYPDQKKGHRKRKELINPSDIDAENAWREFCREAGTDVVGFWPPVHHSRVAATAGQSAEIHLHHTPPLKEGEWTEEDFELVVRNVVMPPTEIMAPIRFSALCPEPEPSPVQIPDELRSQWIKAGFITDHGIDSGITAGESARRNFDHVCLGLSGDRLLDHGYREELHELRVNWEAQGCPALFGIGSAVFLAPESLKGRAIRNQALTPGRDAFYEHVAGFFRRWQLAEMRSWELIVPQGQIDCDTVSMVHSLRGGDALVSFQPAHLPQPNQNLLMEQADNLQREQRRADGFSNSSPAAGLWGRAGKPGEKARIFHMWFIEQTVRGRYPGLRGTATCLMDAFWVLFDKNIGQDQLKKLRKQYLGLFNGE